MGWGNVLTNGTAVISRRLSRNTPCCGQARGACEQRAAFPGATGTHLALRVERSRLWLSHCARLCSEFGAAR